NAAGRLDFYYQVSNPRVATIAIQNFAGIATDVGIRNDDFDGPGTTSVNFLPGIASPDAIDRTDYNFPGATSLTNIIHAANILPSSASAILVVKTTSTSFTFGGGFPFGGVMQYDTSGNTTPAYTPIPLSASPPCGSLTIDRALSNNQLDVS